MNDIVLTLQVQKLRITEAQDLPLQEWHFLDSSPFPQISSKHPDALANFVQS